MQLAENLAENMAKLTNRYAELQLQALGSVDPETQKRMAKLIDKLNKGIANFETTDEMEMLNKVTDEIVKEYPVL